MAYFREPYDDKNEAIMLRAFGRATDLGFVQTTRNCVFDAIFYHIPKDGTKGVPVCMVEAKRRYHSHGTKATLGIGKKKVTRVRQEAASRGIVPLLVVGFDNGIRVTRMEPEHYEEKVGGRGDRGTWGIEMMYYIPVERFVLLKEFTLTPIMPQGTIRRAVL